MEQLTTGTSKRSKLFLGIVLCVLLLGIGVYLAFIRPSLLVNEARERAEKEIAAAGTILSRADSLATGAPWFKDSYVREPTALLAKGHERIEKVRNAFSQEQSGSWRQKIKRFDGMAQGAKGAGALADSAMLGFNSARQKRDRAFAGQVELQTRLAALYRAVQDAGSRIDAEMPLYPSRYSKSVSPSFAQCSTRYTALEEIPSRSAAFIPPLTDSTGRGDPDPALSLLTPALGASDSLKTVCGFILATLDTLKEHYEKAPEAVEHGKSRLTKAGEILKQKKDSTGFWLKSATAMMAQGKSTLDSAVLLLTKIKRGDKVPDRPEAYVKAVASLALFKASLQGADEEIATAAAAQRKLRELATQIGVMSGLMGQVDANLELARKWHARSAWSAYSNVGQELARELRAMEGGSEQAEKWLSLKVQEFARADQALGALLAKAQSQIYDADRFVDLVGELEDARSSFDRAYRAAKDAIEAERSAVEEYGKYDDDAESDFEDAISTLEEARQNAEDRLWIAALQNAREAESLADGTGAECKRAYADYEEDQRRRSRSSSSDDDDDWDFGSGSSSSDDGGSYDSDYGGSSDNDYGGSSDGDYGSSGDGDYGSSSDGDY